jgi:hypothetical protein
MFLGSRVRSGTPKAENISATSEASSSSTQAIQAATLRAFGATVERSALGM